MESFDSSKQINQNESGHDKTETSMGLFMLVTLAGFLGALTAAILLPKWLPGIVESISGAEPKAYWYLSRSTAFAAYLLLWLSMMLGVGITNKLASLWPGLPSTIELHQFFSILGLVFGFFHGLILMGDRYIGFGLVQVLLPFSTTSYKPFFVGLGQLGFYTMLLITLSFYVRKKIGVKMWRAIHFVSFATYLNVLIHGLVAGTDTSVQWAQWIYLISGSFLIFMVAYRVMKSLTEARDKKLSRNELHRKQTTV